TRFLERLKATTHHHKTWLLWSGLVFTSLVSCSAPAGTTPNPVEPTITVPATVTPTETAGCQLFESSNRDVADGAGHATPQQALEVFIADDDHLLPGEPVLETEEGERAVWALLENGERVGFVRAERTADGLWNITSGESCAE